MILHSSIVLRGITIVDANEEINPCCKLAPEIRVQLIKSNSAIRRLGGRAEEHRGVKFGV